MLIVAALLGIGWFESYIQPYHQTVVTVGPMRADMDYFIKRLKEVLPQFSNSDPQVVVSVAPASTADQIVEDFVILQRAGTAGVTATDPEVDQSIQQQLGVISVNGAIPDRSALEAGLRDKLGTSGLTLDQYRQEIRAAVLRNKIQTKLGSDYPTTGPEVQYQALVLNKSDDAKSLLDRLNGGESWDSVAATVHANATMGTVTQYDYQPQLEIDENLAVPLIALSNGQHTDVVNTSDGKYTIAMLVDKDPSHPISSDQLQAIMPKIFSNWLDGQKKALSINENLSDDQKVFAMAHSGWQPSTSPQVNTAPAPGVPQSVPALPPGVATPPGGLVPPPVPAPAGSAGP